jgi:hypothetical protein
MNQPKLNPLTQFSTADPKSGVDQNARKLIADLASQISELATQVTDLANRLKEVEDLLYAEDSEQKPESS